MIYFWVENEEQMVNFFRGFVFLRFFIYLFIYSLIFMFSCIVICLLEFGLLFFVKLRYYLHHIYTRRLLHFGSSGYWLLNFVISLHCNNVIVLLFYFVFVLFLYRMLFWLYLFNFIPSTVCRGIDVAGAVVAMPSAFFE